MLHKWFVFFSSIVVGLFIFSLGAQFPPDYYVDEQGYTWESLPSVPALPARIHYVDTEEELYKTCRFPYPSHVKIYGCARRSWSSGYCTIIVPHNPPEWLMIHEEKHCKGYNHL